MSECPNCGFQLTPPNMSRAKRLPADWEAPDSWISWAIKQRPQLNAREQAAMFKDYWTAKSGKDASKLDWEATWRNWIRNAKATLTSVASDSTRPARSSAPSRRLSDQERSKSLGTNLPKILEQLGIKSPAEQSKS